MDASDGMHRAAATGLCVAWWGLLAVLPIGHITGLRNGLTVVVVVASLFLLGRRSWSALPGRWIWSALLAWCALSIAWSSVPDVSWGKWRTDLFLPFLAYWSAFAVVRHLRGLRFIVGGVITGLAALTGLSLFALVPRGLSDRMRGNWPFEDFANVSVPLPHWYPGVGDASMASVLAAAILLVGPKLYPDIHRAWWLFGWLALATVVAVSNNRNAALVIPFIALIYFWKVRHRSRGVDPSAIVPSRGARRFARVAVAVLIGLVILTGVFALLELGARERLRVIGHSPLGDSSAALVLAERDTRPMIWSYYGKLAMISPIVGVGFGRTVPGMHFHTQADRELARVEFNAYIHAHNLFLNWWLQVGIVGVSLLIALLAEIVRWTRRAAHHSTPDDSTQHVAIEYAIYAVIVLMVARNLTDDFLVYGMATMFWAIVGGLAGALLAQQESQSWNKSDTSETTSERECVTVSAPRNR